MTRSIRESIPYMGSKCPRKSSVMTLIIGFHCNEGVAIVSDTLVTSTETGTPRYESKIKKPLVNIPFLVGAAGYADLFNEFNRKVPLIIQQRTSEYQVNNISQLIRTGLSRDQAIRALQPEVRRLERAQESTPPSIEEIHHQEASIEGISLPYAYTAENFLDDCKSLVRSISEQVDEIGNPLEVLIGLHRGLEASLHLVDSQGREHQIGDYFAIGTGRDHVRMFFNRLYSSDKTITELINYAFFAIAYATHVAKDPYVGYNKTKPPEAFVILNDGRSGQIKPTNTDEIFSSIDRQISDFVTSVQALQIPSWSST